MADARLRYPRPVAAKLGIRPGETILAINAPDDYPALLGPLPEGVRVAARATKATAPFVHLFVTSLAELDTFLPRARAAMTVDGMIWVSWYKMAARVPTDVSETLVRERALATDLVDVNICAVSDLWSGLKLVIRKHLR
jgi:hypothetical protein